MFVHAVYFWLKETCTSEQRKGFAEAVKVLTTLGTVVSGYTGPAVPSDRAVVDSSYAVGLLVTFADSAGHETYQVDPLHLAFIEKWRSCWETVKVYDFIA